MLVFFLIFHLNLLAVVKEAEKGWRGAAGQTLCPTVLRWDLALLPAQTPSTSRGESESGWMPTSAWGKLGEHYCWVLKFKKM